MVMTIEWLAPEKKLLSMLYEQGVPVREIASKIGRSEASIRRAVGRWKLHRPMEHQGVDMRLNLAWPRIRAALERSQGMTISEICEACGMFKSVVLKAIGDHRNELDLIGWIPTTRRLMSVWKIGTGREAVKPNKARIREVNRVNPFLVAAGQVSAPRGTTGRVFRRMDVLDEDREAA